MALGSICIGWRFANHIVYLFPLHQKGKIIPRYALKCSCIAYYAIARISTTQFINRKISKRKQDTPKDSGKAKKTDEAQPDQEDEGEGEEEFEINENEARESPRPPSKASKTDLDEPIASSSVDEEDAEDNEVSEYKLVSRFELT